MLYPHTTQSGLYKSNKMVKTIRNVIIMHHSPRFKPWAMDGNVKSETISMVCGHTTLNFNVSTKLVETTLPTIKKQLHT